VLHEDERALFADARPAGFILFARNCQTPDQIRALTGALRATAGWDAPLLIDQEDGRVARLRPPHWPARPAAGLFGRLARREPERAHKAAWLNARLIAADLNPLGITVDCLPVLDRPTAGAHPVIGDRAFDDDPALIATLGRAVCDGLLAGGVLPVIKHIPGHGRASADSHQALPVVDAPLEALTACDFAPFAALADMPLAMTAHVTYSALDAGAPATTSAKVIAKAVRGAIGFDGALISDDICMKALGGPVDARARAALAAGCDVVLHCNGAAGEMAALARALPPITPRARARLVTALTRRQPPKPFDAAQAQAFVDAALETIGSNE